MYGDKEREYEELGVIQVKSVLRESQNLWLNNKMSRHHRPQPTSLHIEKALIKCNPKRLMKGISSADVFEFLDPKGCGGGTHHRC